MEDDQVFFARGRHQSAGLVRSFEISQNENNTVTIHYYSKFGKPNVFFIGHVPNEEEIKEFEKTFSLGYFEIEKNNTSKNSYKN